MSFRSVLVAVDGEPAGPLGNPGGGLLLPESRLLPVAARPLPVIAVSHAGTNDCEEAPDEEAEEEPLPEAASEHDQRQQHQPYEDEHLRTSCSLAKSTSGHVLTTRDPHTLLAPFLRDYAQDGARGTACRQTR